MNALVTALVENRSDLLNHTVALLHRRAFQLDSVLFGRTDQDRLARLTFSVAGGKDEGERLRRELGRLLYVLEVADLTERPAVVREMALVKVAAGVDQRDAMARLCDLFRARVVDVGPRSMVVEITGEGQKIDGFLELVQPFELVEMVRTGPLALARADESLEAPLDSSWAAHTAGQADASHSESTTTTSEER